MKNFTNPLDNIKIASPCAANWNEMYVNDRKRFCSECKLNVYNLSDMTQTEAENFLINSEGRVCLRVFRRLDGSVLTQNCPVGWQAIKRRASRVTTAMIALIATVFSGILGFKIISYLNSITVFENTVDSFEDSKEKVSFGLTDGILENLPELKVEILRNRSE